MKVREIEKEKPGNIMAIRHLVSGANYKKSFQETGNPDSVCFSHRNMAIVSND